MLRAGACVSLLLIAITACGGDDDATGGTSPTQTRASATALEIDHTVVFRGADPDDAAAGMAVGDVNGDGALDMVLGAAFADGPKNDRQDAGEVLVFLGPFTPGETRDASVGDADVIIYGDDAGDQAGRAVAAADVNGDGIDDIIVGVPFADGPNNGSEDAGEADVVFGSEALGTNVREVALSDGTDLAVTGPASGALTGFSLATGNLNGDGTADLVVGSFQADGAGGLAKAGAVHVIYGSDALPSVIDTSSGDADVEIIGPVKDGWLGETVGTGDFNGDGLDDLLLTAAFAPTLSGEDAGGRVSVVLSPLPEAVDLSSQDADYTIYGEGEGDQIGHSSATGDVDGDGRDDLLLGAVSSDGPDDAVKLAGEAIFLKGSSLMQTVDVAAGDADAIAYGTEPADRLGRSVALGDVDGDGLADLVFGLPGADAPSPPIVDAGAVYVVFSGPPLPARLDLVADGEAYFGGTAGDQLTSGIEGRPALATADIDGDGRDEILVSASNGGGISGAGLAYILFLAEL